MSITHCQRICLENLSLKFQDHLLVHCHRGENGRFSRTRHARTGPYSHSVCNQSSSTPYTSHDGWMLLFLVTVIWYPCLRVYAAQIYVDLSSQFFELLLESYKRGNGPPKAPCPCRPLVRTRKKKDIGSDWRMLTMSLYGHGAWGAPPILTRK